MLKMARNVPLKGTENTPAAGYGETLQRTHKPGLAAAGETNAIPGNYTKQHEMNDGNSSYFV
jgi:hypothetical protein